MMAAKGKNNRHVPVLRSVPPALALRPGYPMHYALLLTNDLHHKTEAAFPTTGILVAEISLNAHKGPVQGGIRQVISHLSPQLQLKTLREPESECRSSLKENRKMQFAGRRRDRVP
jgi:hypothetical protein